MKIPMYHGIIQRIMIGGIPRNIAVLGGTIAGAIIIGLQNLLVIPVIIAIYLLLLFLYKKDHYFLEILIEHINNKAYLLP